MKGFFGLTACPFPFIKWTSKLLLTSAFWKILLQRLYGGVLFRGCWDLLQDKDSWESRDVFATAYKYHVILVLTGMLGGG